jgi:hypothetical protein
MIMGAKVIRLEEWDLNCGLPEQQQTPAKRD